MNLAEKYYIEALSNYPYNLSECFEALNYALSYEENYAPANCLLGELYIHQMQDYTKGISYLERALVNDKKLYKAYYALVSCLIDLNELKRAEEILLYAKKVEGIDSCFVQVASIKIEEKKGYYTKCLEMLKEAKQHVYYPFQQHALDELKQRIKSKMPKVKKAKEVKNKELNVKKAS